jgi:hypothetical protein
LTLVGIGFEVLGFGKIFGGKDWFRFGVDA